MGEPPRLGWEVAFLLGLVAVGGGALTGAVALAVSMGVGGTLPASGVEPVPMDTDPVRMLVGAAAAIAFLAVAVAVRPRREDDTPDLHSVDPEHGAR